MGDLDFTVDTPSNIESMSDEELIHYIDSTSDVSCFRFKTSRRLKLLYQIADILGLTLSNDHKLFLLSGSKRILIEAGAGGGKTTLTQLRLILDKIWTNVDGKRINSYGTIALTYNEANTSDVENKHKSMYQKIKINSANLDADSVVMTSTVHAFLLQFITEFQTKLGIAFRKDKSNILSESEVDTLIKVSIKTHKNSHKDNLDEEDEILRKNISLFYNASMERLLTEDEWEDTSQFIDCGITKAQMKDILMRFEKSKKLKKKLTFTDMLTKFLHLMQTDEEARTRVSKAVNYIIADEYQDFSPLMIECLKYFVTDETRLICIGDSDQAIYQFRGAGSANCLRFRSDFSDSKVYVFSKNRRCRNNILDAARDIIELNKLRLPKKLESVKPGGKISIETYKSRETEILKIVNILKEMDYEDLVQTCICYRNRKSSRLLTQILAQNAIPHRVGKGYAAYTYELYGLINKILYMFYEPTDRDTIVSVLWKCTPFNKQQIYDKLGFDAKENRFLKPNEGVPFYKLDWSSAPEKFQFVIQRLGLMSKAMAKGIQIGRFFPELISYINMYYWRWRCSVGHLEDEEMESYIHNIFNVDMTYDELNDFLDEEFKRQARDKNAGEGCYVSTFHSLKGMEFKNLFVIDLNEDIFPNFSLIEEAKYSDELKEEMKEGENRLFYVTLTRAIDNLYLYFDDQNPSIYFKYLSKYDGVGNDKPLVDLKMASTSFGNFVPSVAEESSPTPILETKVEDVTYLANDDMDVIDSEDLDNIEIPSIDVGLLSSLLVSNSEVKEDEEIIEEKEDRQNIVSANELVEETDSTKNQTDEIEETKDEEVKDEISSLFSNMSDNFFANMVDTFSK